MYPFLRLSSLVEALTWRHTSSAVTEPSHTHIQLSGQVRLWLHKSMRFKLRWLDLVVAAARGSTSLQGPHTPANKLNLQVNKLNYKMWLISKQVFSYVTSRIIMVWNIKFLAAAYKLKCLYTSFFIFRGWIFQYFFPVFTSNPSAR